MTSKPSLLIIGGGINGLTIARQAALDGYFSIVSLAEKESRLALHASTRNSGVIHAGFYYDSQSQRGRTCTQGNALMREYCIKNSLPVNKCGKVVVTKSEAEEEVLSKLKDRGDANGCETYLLPKEKLSLHEPTALTNNSFLWSPNTWSASPHAVIKNLLLELQELSVRLFLDHKLIGVNKNVAFFQSGDAVNYDILVNAAGGSALEVGERLGLKSPYMLLPFKGLYLKSRNKVNYFKAHIYPVPNLKQPFLGIHTTLTYDGYLKLGPTAIPVLSEENYSFFEGLKLNQIPSLLFLEASLFLANRFGFRDLAINEFQYLFKNRIIREAQKLTAKQLDNENFEWYSPGIRAQLFDSSKKDLVSDFVIVRDGDHFHLLNSISPAWTCSFQTSKNVVNAVADYLASRGSS